MKKLKLFYLKNQMFVANGIANFIGVFLATGLIHRAEPYPKELFNNPIIYWTDALFSPFAFSFVFVMTFLYEKPIRHYLNALFRRTSIPQDLKLKARQRLLNEPFVLIALDFSMWVLSAIVWSTIHFSQYRRRLGGSKHKRGNARQRAHFKCNSTKLLFGRKPNN